MSRPHRAGGHARARPARRFRPPPRIGRRPDGYGVTMSATLLWVIAVILVVVGIILLVQGQWILGIALILAGLLVGPGGVSVFRSGRRARY